MIRCEVCSGEFEEWDLEDGMCSNCQSSILQDDEIDLGLGDDFD